MPIMWMHILRAISIHMNEANLFVMVPALQIAECCATTEHTFLLLEIRDRTCGMILRPGQRHLTQGPITVMWTLSWKTALPESSRWVRIGPLIGTRQMTGS